MEKGKRTALVLPRVPALVAEVSDSTNGHKLAGLKEKDRIIGIDDNDMRYFDEIKPLVAQRGRRYRQLKVLRDRKNCPLQRYLSKKALSDFSR